MLTELRRDFPDLVDAIDVIRFREGKGSFQLIARVLLQDDSLIHVKEYLFEDGSRKYAYHWQKPDGELIARWDNAGHWRQVASHPHHVHLAQHGEPRATNVRDIHAVLQYIRTASGRT
jgi:hypothetical protein